LFRAEEPNDGALEIEPSALSGYTLRPDN